MRWNDIKDLSYRDLRDLDGESLYSILKYARNRFNAEIRYANKLGASSYSMYSAAKAVGVMEGKELSTFRLKNINSYKSSSKGIRFNQGDIRSMADDVNRLIEYWHSDLKGVKGAKIKLASEQEQINKLLGNTPWTYQDSKDLWSVYDEFRNDASGIWSSARFQELITEKMKQGKSKEEIKSWLFNKIQNPKLTKSGAFDRRVYGSYNAKQGAISVKYKKAAQYIAEHDDVNDDIDW